MKDLHSFNLVSGSVLMSFSGSFTLASGGLLWNEECYFPFFGGFSSAEELKDIVMCIP